MIDIESIGNLFLKNLKINFIFYIGLLISLILFSKFTKTNFKRNILSFILVSFCGYLVHLFSHKFDFDELAEKFIKQKTFITRNSFMKKFLRGCGYFLNFHNDIHHDSEINKDFDNEIFEFIQNFLTQGLLLYLVIIFFKNLNPIMALVWGLYYATVHIINFKFFHSKVHEEHHKNKFTNYGLDVWDILFNTKYNETCDNYNHTVINILILFLFFWKICK